MVTKACLLIGSFLILQTCATIAKPKAPVCGHNEVYSTCSGNCQKTCKDKNPICPSDFHPGCVCRPNYVRDDKTKKCIPEHQCPKLKCERNEVPTICLPHFQATCEQVGNKTSPCRKLPAPCSPGCVCRRNYFRNADNVCTSAADCLKCKKPNEVFGCRRTCDDTRCDTLTKPCKMKNVRCIKKCYCRKGYARDRAGHCIPIDQCPKVKCPVNEELQCVKPCSPRLCSPRPLPIKCPQTCEHKCDCKTGYLRNSKRKCVRINQCPLVCGKNEVVSRCNGHCQRTCAIRRPKCKRVCKRGCICRFGYVRDDNTGKCIKQRACHKTPKVPQAKPKKAKDSSSSEDNESSPPHRHGAPPPADHKVDDNEDNKPKASKTKHNPASSPESDEGSSSPPDKDDAKPADDKNNDDEDKTPKVPQSRPKTGKASESDEPSPPNSGYVDDDKDTGAPSAENEDVKDDEGDENEDNEDEGDN